MDFRDAFERKLRFVLEFGLCPNLGKNLTPASSAATIDLLLYCTSPLKPHSCQSKKIAMLPQDSTTSDSDDGFQDLLSDDEEHETLLAQESVALERRMKTVGIRDGLELGKEDTLQEGFDLGFAQGAARSFRFGRLRGALSTASACGLFSDLNSDILVSCIQQLRAFEKDISVHKDTEKYPPSSSEEADAAVAHALELLKSVGVDLSTSSSK
ncbi:Protein YAE1-like protein [Phytophthora ramorum]|uniref:Protein YAE1-like protein n=1 Tax=Phytophthora ramorum TaxID=164328 RepID=UPI00309956B5|nr:Protein YAE1-like protein [Phytophthora ramorum]